MQVTDLPIDQIKPYPRNPRNNKAAVEKVAESIQQFGWRQPLVIDEDGVVLVGHTRLEAARSLGLDVVPVHQAIGLSDAQKRAYRLADNRVAEYSTWDDELLRVELGELEGMGLDLSLTGFSPTQLRRYAAADMTEDDPVTEPEPIAKPGQIWVLGEHKVMCADATDEAAIQALMGDCRPVLMVTDPPYGVKYDPSWRKQNTRAAGIANDDRADWREAYQLFPGDVAYVWHGALHAVAVAESLAACDFQLRAQIVWAKPRLVIGTGHYHWQHDTCFLATAHETAWYAIRRGEQSHWTGSRAETTLWQIEPDKFESAHPTQKPIECMARPMMNSSRKGDYVYDPFLGTGTSVIAAERTGRRCLGVELEPKYVDVVIARWERESGEKAVLL